MKKLTVHENKTLKLANAISCKLEVCDFRELDKIVYQMENYIKSKGAIPIGPLIQCTEVNIDNTGDPILQVLLIHQSNIFHIKTGYTLHDVIFGTSSKLFVYSFHWRRISSEICI